MRPPDPIRWPTRAPVQHHGHPRKIAGQTFDDPGLNLGIADGCPEVRADQRRQWNPLILRESVRVNADGHSSLDATTPAHESGRVVAR
jgi:hypothetical protein